MVCEAAGLAQRDSEFVCLRKQRAANATLFERSAGKYNVVAKANAAAVRTVSGNCFGPFVLQQFLDVVRRVAMVTTGRSGPNSESAPARTVLSVFGSYHVTQGSIFDSSRPVSSNDRTTQSCCAGNSDWRAIDKILGAREMMTLPCRDLVRNYMGIPTPTCLRGAQTLWRTAHRLDMWIGMFD